MSRKHLVLFLTLLATLPGCTSMEQIYESIYKGIRTRQELERLPEDQTSPQMPSYQQYNEERLRKESSRQQNTPVSHPQAVKNSEERVFPQKAP